MLKFFHKINIRYTGAKIQEFNLYVRTQNEEVDPSAKLCTFKVIMDNISGQ